MYLGKNRYKGKYGSPRHELPLEIFLHTCEVAIFGKYRHEGEDGGT